MWRKSMDERERALSDMAADGVAALSPGCLCRECVRKHWRRILSILEYVEAHEYKEEG